MISGNVFSWNRKQKSFSRDKHGKSLCVKLIFFRKPQNCIIQIHNYVTTTIRVPYIFAE